MLIKNDWVKKTTFTFELTKFNNIMIIEISEKQAFLRNSFFFSARQADLGDIERFNYPPLKEFFIIIKREIRIVINMSHSNKAAKENKLTFRVL